MDDLITFMGYHWLQVEDGVVTIGINENGLEEFSELQKIDLPGEGEEVAADEVCGELDTDQGPLNIYSPVEGRVLEVNDALSENPSLIQEDCFGDGWLLRIEAADPEELDALSQATSSEDE